MSRSDPSGYYAALGLDQSATSDEIKKAFKAKAQQFHPDRNHSPEATRQFQFISEAYQVLGDPQARANYDSRSCGVEEASSPDAGSVDPVRCSVCQRVTAQPRYVVYKHVVSAIFVTWRVVRQGLFWSDCGAKSACRASLKTWLLGWWGIPWGPIFSVHAIVSNMRGGEQPLVNNFRFLGRQAIYFAHIGRSELAHAVARDALGFGRRLSEEQRLPGSEMAELTGTLSNMLAGDGAGGPALVLKDVWGLGQRRLKCNLD